MIKAFQRLVRQFKQRIRAHIRQQQMSRDDLFMGEVLKRNAIITEEQLQTALRVQQETLVQKGRAVRLGLTMVELGYATETEIIQAINANYDINVTSLSDDIREQVNQKYGRFFERLPRPRMPIWLQLSIATTVIIVVTVTTLSIVVLDKQKERLYEQTVRVGMVSLNYFANNASIPMLEDNILQLNTLIKEATRVEGLLYAIIIDTDHVVKAHTDISRLGTTYNSVASNSAATTTRNGVVYFHYRQPDGRRVLNLHRRIEFKEKTLGEVHVGISLDFINQLVRQERFFVLMLTAGIVILGVSVSVVFGRQFSRPVTHLVTGTQEMARGNYHYRVPVRRNDELGRLAVSFNRMGRELWRNTLTQKSFGKYVGAEVLDMILANPETGWLKGTRNEATIVFGDVRGFTSFSTENAPEQVVEALNAYLEIATSAIIQYDGYVDKFIGDAILGVFGVPVFRRDHVERAVRAAMFMQEQLRKEARHGNWVLSNVGISIHTGIVVSGNIGSQAKMEYTVIGDSVNLASRLNGLAGPGEIVISQQVKRRLNELITAESIGPQSMKGIAEPVQVYKLKGIQTATNDGAPT